MSIAQRVKDSYAPERSGACIQSGVGLSRGEPDQINLFGICTEERGQVDWQKSQVEKASEAGKPESLVTALRKMSMPVMRKRPPILFRWLWIQSETGLSAGKKWPSFPLREERVRVGDA